jgi:hypothetical protein
MSVALPPVPPDKIEENPAWRNWFTRVQQVLASATTATIVGFAAALAALTIRVTATETSISALQVSMDNDEVMTWLQ